MKKKSLKSLELNKNKVAHLEEQLKGGTNQVAFSWPTFGTICAKKCWLE
ncbi:hypothetical protein ACJD0Z_08030 [Flavobacteriaceae bacterium M23B6Z8]